MTFQEWWDGVRLTEDKSQNTRTLCKISAHAAWDASRQETLLPLGEPIGPDMATVIQDGLADVCRHIQAICDKIPEAPLTSGF